MSKLHSLDERLMKCAGLVRKSARLADVGSDHAYLPVWLLNQGAVSYAIACDINEKPLRSGRAAAEKYSAQNIEFRLGAGMSVLNDEDRITDVVIAGMGGELIADILRGNPLSEKEKLNFILQPMTRSETLIGWLYENGYEIVSQQALTSKGKPYTVMSVRYTGKNAAVSEAFKIIGKLDVRDEESRKFIQKQMRNLENKSRADRSAKALLDELRLMLYEED